jgi:hypothetical protein
VAVLLPANRGGAVGLAGTRTRERVSEACLAAAKPRARGGLPAPSPSASAESVQDGLIGGRRLALRKRRCWCIACGTGAGGDKGASALALSRHGTSVVHLASAHARLNRPAFVLASGQRPGGTRRWSRLASRRQSRRQPGVVSRQRLAIAFVDSRHRPYTSVWAGVSAGRAGRVVARRQLGHCTIARMLVSFRSVAEVGDRHLLVASGALSGTPRGGQRHEAGHRALTRQAGFGTRTGCLAARTNNQVYRMQSLRLRS